MAKEKQTAQTSAQEAGATNVIQNFYTVETVSEMLGLQPTTVRKYVTQGKLTAYKRAGRLYFLHTDLIAFITG